MGQVCGDRGRAGAGLRKTRGGAGLEGRADGQGWGRLEVKQGWGVVLRGKARGIGEGCRRAGAGLG